MKVKMKPCCYERYKQSIWWTDDQMRFIKSMMSDKAFEVSPCPKLSGTCYRFDCKTIFGYDYLSLHKSSFYEVKE